MSRFFGVVSVGVVCLGMSVARAQPAPGDPPPVGEPPAPVPAPAPEPPPPAAPRAPSAPPAAAPPSATPTLHEQCVERRHQIQSRAQETPDLDERTRLLESLPDCSKPDVVLPPAPPTCGEGQTLVDGACTATGIRGPTSEFSIGLAWLNAGSSSNEIVHGVGGLNIGIGQFVTPNVAVTLRLSGVTSLDKGELYVGVIGPNVQAWAGKAFVGGGIGLGFIVGCPENGSCDGTSISGFNLRTGFLAGDRSTISFEMNSLGGMFTAGSIQTAAILLGFQSF